MKKTLRTNILNFLSKVKLTIVLIVASTLWSNDAFSASIYAISNGDWDDTSIWSTVGSTGPGCGCIPQTGDDVIIDSYAVGFDGGSTDITINSLIITNENGGVADLTISDGRILTVTQNVDVIMARNINKSSSLQLNSNSGPQLLVGGDMTFTRKVTNVRNRACVLNISGDGKVVVDGDYTYDYLNSANQSTNAIYMDADAIFEIKGNFMGNIAASASAGNFNIDIKGKALMTVGSISDPKDFTIDQRGANNVNITIAGGSVGGNLKVFGNANLKLAGGTNLNLDLVADGALYVSDALTLEQTGGSNIIVDINGSGAYIDTKDLIFDASGLNKVAINMGNSSAYFNLRGDVTQTNNYGRFTATNGTMIYNGANAQTVVSNGTGDDAWTYHDLRIDNSSTVFPQVTMGGEVRLEGDLEFIDGVIRTNITNLLIHDANNGKSSGACDSSYVDGPMRKIGNGAYVFPIGKDGSYRSMGIGNPVDNAAEFTAEYMNVNPYTLFYGFAIDVDHVSHFEYWTLDRTVGTSLVPVRLSWDEESMVKDPAGIVVARWDVAATEWQNEGNGGTTGDNLNGSVVSSNPVVTWTPNMAFTLGSSGFTNSNPLPIELREFSATPLNDQVKLDWSTVSEINFDYFEITRSVDGENFKSIGRITGAGNSSTLNVYSFMDKNPFSGVSYYQLKMVDFNGDVDYSSIKKVQIKEEGTIRVFPNPASDLVNVNIGDASVEYITLLNGIGQKIQSEVNLQNKTNISFNVSDLPGGVYFVKIRKSHETITKKLIINK